MSLFDIKDSFLKAIKANENKLIEAITNIVIDSDGMPIGDVVDKYNSNIFLIKKDAVKLFSGITNEQKNIDFNADNDIIKQANELTNERLGINKDGTIVKNGLMDYYLDNPKTRLDLIKAIQTTVDRGLSKSELKKSISNVLGGSLEKHYNQMANDAIKVGVNYRDKLVADKLGLVFFLYSGSERDSSREFCLERKGKYFHIDVFKEWPKTIGDKDGVVWSDLLGVYDPAVDVGGINCVDRIKYVSSNLVKLRDSKLYYQYF